jgi:hypothetical protein
VRSSFTPSRENKAQTSWALRGIYLAPSPAIHHASPAIAVSNPVGEIGIKPIGKHRKIIKIKNRAISIKTAQKTMFVFF